MTDRWAARNYWMTFRVRMKKFHPREQVRPTGFFQLTYIFGAGHPNPMSCADLCILLQNRPVSCADVTEGKMAYCEKSAELIFTIRRYCWYKYAL